ncbi:PepSY domain-containing protein [Brevibacillus sp. HB1.2]|uniref:PepSY domain-containing protein n=1 Tax=Brevibacillus TaxID=55080 RepID=UPI00156B242D|nr:MULTISPECIES: PepSY domain-containing protein [unclassified Brevibacillus]NRS16209.1 PepSY domain-containing protein [Brevibacillus sp. HB1.4B]NTU20129.1 PepSY domain-containing protein [Brevibacillus sp. HB1.2]NTU29369.1 PepSY domain-containing protein [Brevibacillus sp. HB1.1]
MKKVVMTMVGALIVGSLSVTAFAHSNQYYSVPQKNTSTVYLQIDDDVKHNWAKLVRITPEKALKKVREAQSGVITEWKLDDEDGFLVYKAEIKNNHQEFDVYVDAMTGEVWQTVDHDYDDDHDDDNDDQWNKQQVKISVEQAKKIALAKVSGTIKSIKLDEDDNHYVYEVEVKTAKGQEVDLEISATTGAVLDVDWDD